jgi:Rhodopirellula transposase DDE domain
MGGVSSPSRARGTKDRRRSAKSDLAKSHNRNLIGNTRTEAGLKIQAELDKSPNGIGIKVSDEQLAAVRMMKDDFHGEWNYTISPKKRHA